MTLSSSPGQSAPAEKQASATTLPELNAAWSLSTPESMMTTCDGPTAADAG